MKIKDLRTEKNSDRTRVAATVVWEDCDRPTQEIYFETAEAFAQNLTCNPHAFLLTGIMPAMRHGEARISIDAEICPQLRDGLVTAMGLMRHWYGSQQHQPVQIEAKTQSDLTMLRRSERAGSFFSGGIDSLATLRANRLNLPLQHPSSFKDGLLIHGIEKGKDLELFKQAVNSLSVVAIDAGISLIPVYTNARNLDNNSSFWGQKFQGSVLAAAAHVFSQRLTTVTIPSSFDISCLYPLGSHPLLDHNYSNSNLQIRHDSILLSRLDKTKLVADWDVALQNLRVCNNPKLIKPGALNCGQCEKCLRTMLALVVLGKLDKTRAFPQVELSPELLLANIYIKEPPYALSCYRELMAPLVAQGRQDLADAIERIIARYYEEKKREQREEKLKQIKHKVFKGKLLTLYKALAPNR